MLTPAQVLAALRSRPAPPPPKPEPPAVTAAQVLAALKTPRK